MRCKTCHYSLANLTGPPHRCPECGNPFDPNDPSTFTTDPFRYHRLTLRWLGYALLVYLVVFGVALIFFGYFFFFWDVRGAAMVALAMTVLVLPIVEIVKFANKTPAS